jgi:hypothetical protein
MGSYQRGFTVIVDKTMLFDRVHGLIERFNGINLYISVRN